MDHVLREGKDKLTLPSVVKRNKRTTNKKLKVQKNKLRPHDLVTNLLMGEKRTLYTLNDELIT